ncbi:MAG: preprotein translocase subunit SecA [Dehalococcoidia bacterium]|nr:preprotein translocase subunit SecA [Dehalococcoidia bacterium]
MLKLIAKILGDSNEREVKRLSDLVATVNDLEPSLAALDDAHLRARTDAFRARLAAGETLPDLQAEAFATVRETAKRQLGMRHFDVQIIGGAVLHEGKIAEMKTGEGKTLVATLPLYLNALLGLGAHLITVNDYLAKRDAQWMGPVYNALGLSVGVIQHDSSFLFDPDHAGDGASLQYLRPVSRREAYAADITYGTNNEFGFDYLRDNMVPDLANMVQRELHYAIVDEVDNILIDEARTPLIISGAAEESAEVYSTFAGLVPRLRAEEDYTLDEKARAVLLTEEGVSKLENWLELDNIYDPANYRITRYMEAALKAQMLYRLDREYVVKDGEVIIVDDFTGRLMPGRRYSEGLHQAIEAKESVAIQRESITLATVTFQNYFRLYGKLSGMTGTAVTESEEFAKIYKLDVVVVPTHREMVREDYGDLVYRSERAKFDAVVEEIVEAQEDGQPVLVGTVSIEKSEYLSELLKRRGITHEVLNAKQHEREAHIVERAGERGGVTIATNMAGRGTDIKLGEGVAELGGLHIIGTERHEARRIDNQLRGRAGRQGDPGSSRFFVSFEDDIMRRFAPDWLPGMMAKLGMEENMPIESSWVTRAIETAQTKVEGYHFDMRKRLVDYDDVMNLQRETVYTERRKVLEGADVRANILRLVHEELDVVLLNQLQADPDFWDLESLVREVGAIVPLGADEAATLEPLSRDEIAQSLHAYADERYEAREEEFGPEAMRQMERLIMLGTIDQLWTAHLTEMDEMRQGIGLRAYGQGDPLVHYKKEAHDMYGQLMENIRSYVARAVYHVSVITEPQPARRAASPIPAAVGAGPRGRNIRTNRDEPAPARAAGAARTAGATKVGRNDPCPCGSGLKYKKCHGGVPA